MAAPPLNQTLWMLLVVSLIVLACWGALYAQGPTPNSHFQVGLSYTRAAAAKLCSGTHRQLKGVANLLNRTPRQRSPKKRGGTGAAANTQFRDV